LALPEELDPPHPARVATAATRTIEMAILMRWSVRTSR